QERVGILCGRPPEDAGRGGARLGGAPRIDTIRERTEPPARRRRSRVHRQEKKTPRRFPAGASAVEDGLFTAASAACWSSRPCPRSGSGSGFGEGASSGHPD